MKRTLLAFLVTAAVTLGGCSKSSTTSKAKPSDAVQQKLEELAGKGATDCGRIKSQSESDVKPAGECAMQAAQGKRAFYVAYDLPGMTVAVAGDSSGKLYFVQTQGETSAEAKVQASPCPSELRVAQSGRVTCFAPGSMGGMGANPHGGAAMPATGGPNPHSGAAVPSHPGSNPNK